MYAKKNNGKKIVVLLLAIILLIGCTIGSTLAWLVADKQTISNTFVAGDIGTLRLEETLTATQTATQTGNNNTYVIVPGTKITKDPKVTYTPAQANDVGSVYIFVEVTGGAWAYDSTDSKFIADDLSWTVADGWTYLSGNVFYMTTAEAVANKGIIAGNEIAVASTITKGADMTAAVTAANGLTFTAYAIQAEGFDGVVSDAWTAAKANSN